MTAAYPYRIFGAACIDASGWRFVEDDSPLADYLPAWDYMSTHRLRRTLVCDGWGMRTACGLGASASLAVHARYWSTGSHLRYAGKRVAILASESAQEIEVLLPLSGSTFAGDSLVVETTVVLTGADASAGVFSPHRPGSILWRDMHEIRLQGTAGVMPTTPLRFSENGLPGRAAWLLDIDASRWHAPLLGSMQVLLNVEHPTVAQALDGSLPKEAAAVLWASLRVDVVLDILMSAVADLDFDVAAPMHDEDGSLLLGGFVNGVIRRNLRKVGESGSDAFKRLRSELADPPRFRASVQDALGGLVAQS